MTDEKTQLAREALQRKEEEAEAIIAAHKKKETGQAAASAVTSAANETGDTAGVLPHTQLMVASIIVSLFELYY